MIISYLKQRSYIGVKVIQMSDRPGHLSKQETSLLELDLIDVDGDSDLSHLYKPHVAGSLISIVSQCEAFLVCHNRGCLMQQSVNELVGP